MDMQTNKKAKILLEYAAKTNGAMVEIGSIRNPTIDEDDGYSTLFLAKFAQENRREFTSYDIEQKNVDIANKVLIENGLKKCVYRADGKTILPMIGEIGFLYLDSSKFPIFSLEQYKAANLSKNSIVAIDDAHSFEEYEYGKATFLVQWFNKEKIKYEIVSTQPGYRMVIAQFPNGKETGEL